MHIEYTTETGITLRPDGMFDYSAGYNSISEIERLIAEHKDAQVTVDFGSVDYLDSSGIGALIAMQRHLPHGAPKMRLLRPSSTVQKLLEICHLHQLFDIQPRDDSG